MGITTPWSVAFSMARDRTAQTDGIVWRPPATTPGLYIPAFDARGNEDVIGQQSAPYRVGGTDKSYLFLFAVTTSPSAHSASLAFEIISSHMKAWTRPIACARQMSAFSWNVVGLADLTETRRRSNRVLPDRLLHPPRPKYRLERVLAAAAQRL
ncbi:MAG: hypothetical protein ACLT3W_06265 [Bifidobacterium pseudocatenulatum]